jgi:hypothetical protein
VQKSQHQTWAYREVLVGLFRFHSYIERGETITNAVFWDATGLLVTTNVVHSSPILVTLMMEALDSSEASVLKRAIRRNNPEDTILHSHRRENLSSYIALTG